MSQEPKPGGRRRANVAPDSPSTVEIPVIKRRAEQPAPPSPPTAPSPSVPATPVHQPTQVSTARPKDPQTKDRRTGRRLNPLTVLAVSLPLATVAALALVQPPSESVTTSAPTTTELTQATVLCPPADNSTTWVGLADPSASGPVNGLDGDTIAPGAVVKASESVIVGAGATAPGLASITTESTQALTCAQPQFDQWFTGLGASAVHQSTLILTNPDAGTAVADLTVYGNRGEVDAAQDLRGISVPGGQSISIDLAERMPVADDLAVHVGVSRGRLGVQVHDRQQPIGVKTAATDWVTPQRAPSKEVRLLGLGAGAGTRTLTLLNPTQNEARVSLQLISDKSEFAPTDLEPLTLPPGQVRTVDLSKAIDNPLTAKTRGVRVSGTQAVVAGLSSMTGSELVVSAPTVSLSSAAGLPLPGGAQRVVLAGSEVAGRVGITTRAADGTTLHESTIEVAPGRSVVYPLDQKVRWVTVEPGETGVGGVVTLGSNGHSVLALWPLVTHELAPAVEAALG